MAGLGAGVVVAHEDQLRAAQSFQVVDGRRMGDQFGDGSAPELDILAPPLMDAVVDVEGLELVGLFLKPLDVVRVQQPGQDQVAFHLQVPDAFSQAQPGPIGLNDAIFLFEHVSLFSHGNRYGSASLSRGPAAAHPQFTRWSASAGHPATFLGRFQGTDWAGRARGRVDLALQSDGSASIPPPHQPSPAGSASATPPQGGSDTGAPYAGRNVQSIHGLHNKPQTWFTRLVSFKWG